MSYINSMDGREYNSCNNQLYGYVPPGSHETSEHETSEQCQYRMNKEAEESLAREAARREAWQQHLIRWRKFKKWFG